MTLRVILENLLNERAFSCVIYFDELFLLPTEVVHITSVDIKPEGMQMQIMRLQSSLQKPVASNILQLLQSVYLRKNIPTIVLHCNIFFFKCSKNNNCWKKLPERACLLLQTCFRGQCRQQIYAWVFLPGTSMAPKNWTLLAAGIFREMCRRADTATRAGEIFVDSPVMIAPHLVESATDSWPAKI